MKQVLIIDPDRETVAQLRTLLRAEGYDVESYSDGVKGFQKAMAGGWTMVITENTLPNMGGFDLVHRLREHSQVPIMMISSNDSEADRVLALEFGADDFLPKPLPKREFVARFRALIRRSRMAREAAKNYERTGDIHIFADAHTAYKGDSPLDLSNMEYRLLEYLVQHAAQKVSREELVRNVMNRAYDPLDRSVDMHVSGLRKKLGTYSDGSSRIRTIRGIGYLYALPARTIGRDDLRSDEDDR